MVPGVDARALREESGYPRPDGTDRARRRPLDPRPRPVLPPAAPLTSTSGTVACPLRVTPSTAASGATWYARFSPPTTCPNQRAPSARRPLQWAPGDRDGSAPVS